MGANPEKGGTEQNECCTGRLCEEENESEKTYMSKPHVESRNA